MTDPVFVRIRGTDRNLRFHEFLLFVRNKDTEKKISTVHFPRFEHWSIVFQIQRKKERNHECSRNRNIVIFSRSSNLIVHIRVLIIWD